MLRRKRPAESVVQHRLRSALHQHKRRLAILAQIGRVEATGRRSPHLLRIAKAVQRAASSRGQRSRRPQGLAKGLARVPQRPILHRRRGKIRIRGSVRQADGAGRRDVPARTSSPRNAGPLCGRGDLEERTRSPVDLLHGASLRARRRRDTRSVRRRKAVVVPLPARRRRLMVRVDHADAGLRRSGGRRLLQRLPRRRPQRRPRRSDARRSDGQSADDAEGRPWSVGHHGRIGLITYGKTRAQRLDMVRKAAAEIAELAHRLGVPIAAERLDFGRKRAELGTVVGRKRARMLSSFAYTTFADALARVCVRRSIRLAQVNPAYTSLIGRVKFAPRYGSSVHAAAALAIARRAMALSERLPASGETIPVVLASGDRVTLPRPARIGRRHVWSSWSRLSAGLSAVHAGRRGARQGARSGGARGGETSGAAATGIGSRRPFSGRG